jgi:nitrate reductase cytochrome c-type subunit
MNKIFALLLAVTLSAGVMAAETERVCVDVKDPKTGKMKEECKVIKKHKKLEGTEVPKK